MGNPSGSGVRGGGVEADGLSIDIWDLVVTSPGVDNPSGGV